MTLASATAYRAVEKVLLHTVAHTRAEFGRRAREGAILAVAGVGVVLGSIGTHQGLALLIPGGALSAGALQVLGRLATSLAIWRRLIGRARSRCSGADFLGITLSGAGSAYCPIGGKLAALAAVLVGVITDCVVLESASGRIAAGIGPTALGTTTVTVLSFLHDAIATLMAGDGRHPLIVLQAVGLDTVAPQGRTHVANGARAEVGYALTGGRIHDVLGASITGRNAEGTTLLRIHRVGGGTSLRVTVVDGAKGMTRFMSNDLPFRCGFGHHIGTTHRLPCIGGSVTNAELAQP